MHPDTRQFEQALLSAMLPDRRPMLAQYIRLSRHGPPPWAGGNPNGPDAPAWHALRDRLQRSTARANQRLEARPRPKFALDLPISQKRDLIAQTIRDHQVCVICGETGSGKTTQLPQICLELGRGARGLIGHTQPRRIAARTVATRIAEELDVSLGKEVGFKVRFGDQTSDSTFIKLMTDGILLAETQGDRCLEHYDTLIIDEAHERSLNIDFLLGYLRQLLPKRPDLKVIITSATIDPQRLSNHFGGPHVAPVIEVSGRMFPVDVRYHPVSGDEDDRDRDQLQAILDAVDEISYGTHGDSKGDVLVFLATERDIRETAEALRKHHPPSTEILPLFARLAAGEQMKVFDTRRAPGSRRIVLATNVAETSLTVPGIRYVIDPGFARISRYSHRTKVQRLPIEPVSRASADQRKGRCGRVAEGVCIRLYSEQDYLAREAFTAPEILRTNLASVILQMKSLRLGEVEHFPFVEAPDSRMIADGYETLHELGALDDANRLTPLGERLAKLPVDPRIGRMLLAAEGEGCLDQVLVIASALSIQDPRERPMAAADAADQAHARFRHEDSDFLTLLNLWQAYRTEGEHASWNKLRQWCHKSFLSFMRMREWEEVHQQLKGLCADIGLKPARFDAAAAPLEDRVHRALLTGLFSNVAFRGESFDYQGCRGSKLAIFPGSVLFKKGPKWVMAAELVQTTRLYARTVGKIQPEWLEQLGWHVLKRSYSDAHWQRETGQVCAFEKLTLFGLTVHARRRVHYGPIEPKLCRELFIHHALVEGELPGDPPAPFLAHNAAIIEQAREMEAKARRSDILADTKARFAFYDARLPADVYSTGAFNKWRAAAERANPRLLFMSPRDAMNPAAPEVSPERFPDAIPLRGGLASLLEPRTDDDGPVPTGQLTYVLDPGGEDDGLTLTVPLEALSQLDEHPLDWLVPGMLREKVAALVKTLPKHIRANLSADAVAEHAVESLPFGQGNLLSALSDAIRDKFKLVVPTDAWQPRALPTHLQMAVEVVDADGKSLGRSRDVASLKDRLAGRARAALAGVARQQFGQEGLSTWSFGDLPERFDLTRKGVTLTAYPAVFDRGDTVAVALADSPDAAARATHLGVRRLLALACKDELLHRLRAVATTDAMLKHYAPMGPPAELLADLVDLIVERCFLLNQPPIRTADAYEARLAACWGRLGQVAIETAGNVARILEARHRVAHRLAAGVPRTWADSVADLREHAEYLLPRGFVRLTPPDALAHFPRYVAAMQMRLEKLREGGTPREAKALSELLPAWKLFTAWAARRAADDTKAQIEADELAARQHAAALAGDSASQKNPAPSAGGKKKSVLPTNRRSVPVLPTEIAAWFLGALTAGRVPEPVRAYRWMLEELRVSLFAQELGTAQPVSSKRLADQWAKVADAPP